MTFCHPLLWSKTQHVQAGLNPKPLHHTHLSPGRSSPVPSTRTAFPEQQLLASGDYEGRITVWNLFTGEKRMSLVHRWEGDLGCGLDGGSDANKVGGELGGRLGREAGLVLGGWWAGC